MEEFLGTVSLVGDADHVSAKAEASPEALRIVAGSVDIGEWDVNAAKLDFRGDGLHLRDGEDELVFLATDQDGCKKALQKRRSLGRPQRSQRTTPTRRAPRRRLLARIQDGWKRIPRRYRPFVVGAAVLVVLGVVWPWLLVVVLAITAAVSLLAGMVTGLDPFLAVRLPNKLTPAVLLGAGLGGLVLLVVGAIFF